MKSFCPITAARITNDVSKSTKFICFTLGHRKYDQKTFDKFVVNKARFRNSIYSLQDNIGAK